ncbi:expressed unknown protein [Seminavis robusta]|uniref:Uncharacterized protein n=1 Tax=Seminavis robusta TaxID=568900 RepID=A0A9N8EQJ7_9STRA|nr:expressed unknown protein [Seminavis robusta]|eukprot:Sro1609_g285760.1 n/a (530) ;mRNA; f:21480-23161
MTLMPTTQTPTASPRQACEPVVQLYSENFESTGSEQGWVDGSIDYGAAVSHFLGRLGTGHEEVSRSFLIPSSPGTGSVDAHAVTLQFILYQIDDWTPDDKAYAIINGIYVDLGQMSATSFSGPLSGFQNGISWQRETILQGSNFDGKSQLDKKHAVLLTVPASFFNNSTITVAFRVETTEDIDNESAGIDNIVVSAQYDCETMSPSVAPSTASPSYECVLEVGLDNQDYTVDAPESDLASLYAPNFSQFLGLLGSGSNNMGVSITIPPSTGEAMNADLLSIEFNLYQIDEWNPQDKIFLQIGDIEIDLGEMDATSVSEPLDGYEGGITWHRDTVTQCVNLDFGDQMDKKHAVELTIPSSLFPDNKLDIGFRVETSLDLGSESAVVDELRVTAHYDCETSGPVSTLAPSAPSPTTLAPNGIPTTSSPTTPAPTMLPRCAPTAAPTSIEPTSEAPSTLSPSLTTVAPTGPPTGTPTSAPTTVSPTVASGHPSSSPTTGIPTAAPTTLPTGPPVAYPTSNWHPNWSANQDSN